MESNDVGASSFDTYEHNNSDVNAIYNVQLRRCAAISFSIQL